MKLKLFNEQTFKLWAQMAGGEATGIINPELEIYKRLVNFFQAGDYFYFILNLKSLAFETLSPQVEAILGYPPSAVTVPLFMDCIHPDDRPWFLAFETMTAEFLSKLPLEKLMKYKVRYDFRLKRKNGEHIRVLHQSAVVDHDDAGGINSLFCVHTDITHLKKEGRPVLSYIGMGGEPSFVDIDVKSKFIGAKKILTKREKEILNMLMKGMLSKEISAALHISKQTVDTHRKNMIQRNGLANTGELIGKAINQGWV